MEINKIYLGNNLELLKKLEPNSIHSCVSDFPYNLGFMGKKWDTITNYQDWCYQRAIELFRVLKPGGVCLIFGGSRTHHRLVCGFEDAGFIIKDEMQWIYKTGFPKNYNVEKGFNKQNKIELSKQWDGYGTALKPAQEPVMMCQKPIEKNYCNNVEKYGVGVINIDVCRIPYDMNDTNPATNPLYRKQNGYKTMCGTDNDGNSFKLKSVPTEMNVDSKGRFPTNIIFDEQSEISGFFYCAKATKKEKTENGLVDNKHPTVKPISLIKYLIKLVTPPNGICIDICEGSGTHARAIQELNKEGFNFNYIGFENDEDSYNTSNERILVGS